MRMFVFAVAAMLAWPAVALGAERNMSYSFFELAYASADFETDEDGADISADGHQLRWSREFSDIVFLFGDYRKLTGDVRLTTRSLGIGAAFGLGSRTDFYGTLGIADSKLNWELERGFAVEAGLRHQLVRSTELFARYRHVDIYEEADSGYEAGFRYWPRDSVSVSLSYMNMDSEQVLSLGGRFNF